MLNLNVKIGNKYKNCSNNKNNIVNKLHKTLIENGKQET